VRVPRVYRTEAVVLKAFDYGEADRILTLYTPQHGKVRAIAKGVRRIKSRKAGHLEIFTRTALLIARGRQLDVVTQADTLEPFRPVRDDLWRIAACTYVAELVDGFGMENLTNYPLYALTVQTLRRLAESSSLDLTLRAFELQLLGLTGYRPQLHRCLQCNDVIVPAQNRFSSKMGGVLCPSCGISDVGARAIGIPALKLLRNLQTNESAVLAVNGLDETVEREVESLLRDYILYRLENRPRSLAFIDRLRAEAAGARV